MLLGETKIWSVRQEEIIRGLPLGKFLRSNYKTDRDQITESCERGNILIPVPDTSSVNQITGSSALNHNVQGVLRVERVNYVINSSNAMLHLPVVPTQKEHCEALMRTLLIAIDRARVC